MYESDHRLSFRLSPGANERAGSAPAGGALRDSEVEFAKLVAGVRDYAVFLLDRHGNVASWNAGAERFKGYHADEIIGQHFSRFYPPEVAATGWPAHELEVAAETGRFEEEGWRVRKDGSRFWASVTITALKEEGGDVRGFLKITRDLTQRKQTEEKLRFSEERFRLLVESVKDYAIFMLDTQGRVATWNAGAERLKGYQAAEIIGQHFSKFYPPEAIDRGWPAEELRRSLADGRVEDEGWRVRKDGSLFWASVVITPVFDDTGAHRGFSKVTRDLTDRRRAEENSRQLAEVAAARKVAEEFAEEINQQRQQLEVTLASIGDAVIVTNAHGEVTFLNPVASELTGWTEAEAAGQNLGRVFQIVNEKTRHPHANPVELVFRENRVVELANHTVLLTKDGREIPIEDSAAPIRDRHGNITGAILVFRDVTRTRRAIEARLYLAAIVDSTDDAIIGETLDGRIASWNRGAERLYGYTADEIVGKPLSLLEPADHPAEIESLTARLRKGELVERLETQRIRKDGKVLDVSLTISPVIDEDGEVIGASKIARDITAQREEERRRTEFLALLAHELRNPLAPLRNGLQIMALAEDDPETVADARGAMERQVQHLIRLVDDLLDISRITQGKLTLRKEIVSLTDLISHALDICRPAVSQDRHELLVTIPEEPVFLEVDVTRVSQILCNLLTNAAKYSEPETPIELAIRAEPQAIEIRIRDHGIGIPAHELENVFNMFMQVDRSLERSRGGLGVGLAIVKRLAELHGGSVEAHSEGPGRGSVFIVRLPRPHAATAPVNNHSPQAAAHLTRRRVLVVDDNIDAARSTAALMKLLGHEVSIAHDGAAGVEAASQMRPDLILLDIGMPRLNGYEAARMIRALPWGRSVQLVAVTGWGQIEDRELSKAAGFDTHLVKPVESSALIRILAEGASSVQSAEK